jgi:hypothetical protein
MNKVQPKKWELDIKIPPGKHLYKFKFIPANAKVRKGLEGRSFVWIWDIKNGSSRFSVGEFHEFKSPR